MSGSTSVSVAVAAAAVSGGDGYRPPFTAVQRQELEHQALIYKYLVAGVPVPSDLVLPIRRSLEALSARFFNHPSLGYCSYYGKKFDPEPGRCRRTDGKKWRCSKDAYPDSKYCERHMHRGRNRSRKPVESQTTTQSLSTTMSHITTASSAASGNGSYQSVTSGTFQSLPLYPIANSDSLGFGNSVPKLQDASPYGISNKDYRYAQGVAIDVDDQNYSSGASGNLRGLGMDSSIEGTWRLVPTQAPSSSLLKSTNDSYSQINSTQLHMANTYEPMIDATAMSKQRQQHCFFGGEIGSPVQVKHEQCSMRPFFDEWPKAREPWADLDADSKNSFSTTQLSISMAPSEFTARGNCSPDGV